jgi:1-deoxy-D-xylulose-5-phosphate reductoisomerase
VKKRIISIFGSTGTIGQNAVDVVLQNPDFFQVEVLVAHKNYHLLSQQAKTLKPKYIAIYEQSLLWNLQDILSDNPEIQIFAGSKAINDLAKIKCDIFISAIVGIEALLPTFNAIKFGSNIGLANKECLVAVGDLLLEEAKRQNIKIIPIDSEHNAIFQIFEQDNFENIENITLTASGGSFLNATPKELENVTLEQAIRHPNWNMGAKISVDSSTMMNKALEMIEAWRLFNINENKINVIIHPSSIIHGLVSYKDGNNLAVMSCPDMRIPISYALFYPKRQSLEHEPLNLAKISRLEFFEANEEKILPLKLARQVINNGGNSPAVFNITNELAVEMFLKEKIKFNEITKIVEKTINEFPINKIPNIEEISYLKEDVKCFVSNMGLLNK